jgi:GNAT superfamily N-acetyltransferase
MHVTIDHTTPAATSYRAARVKSLFNATDEQATRFTLTADLDVDDDAWRVGLVVGPSGSGKTSIGRALWNGEGFYEPGGWPDDAPIVDAIAPGGAFDDVTAALAQAGLGDVPVWLRPYRVLSNGQRFRADLARILAERPARVVFDEFTSVVDRQIAKVGAQAFGKAWKRGTGQAVLLSCHYDIVEWLQPDWIFDTATHEFTRGSVQPRPPIDVEIRMGGWDLWPFFKPHHYLDSGPMVTGKCYVAFVDGEPVAHLGVSTKNVTTKDREGRRVSAVEARACRLVVMPEWQGAGVGLRFLNHVAQKQFDGDGVLAGRRMTTLFHTSHPQLCAALRRNPRWRQVSATLHGDNRNKAVRSINKALSTQRTGGRSTSGYGGHFRSIQGFRYFGEQAAP